MWRGHLCIEGLLAGYGVYSKTPTNTNFDKQKKRKDQLGKVVDFLNEIHKQEFSYKMMREACLSVIGVHFPKID